MVVLKKVRKIEKRTLKNTCHSKSITMRILSVNLLKKNAYFHKKNREKFVPHGTRFMARVIAFHCLPNPGS